MLGLPVNQACLCLLLCTALFNLYSFLRNPDPYHCGDLLSGGHWTNVPKQWQPPGCMMKTYGEKDLAACHLWKLTFIGDSTIRQLFWATAEKLDQAKTEQATHKAGKHNDLTFTNAGVELSFVWDPFLNTSALQHHLITFRSGGGDAPSILVVGGGLWHARYLDQDYLQDYGEAVDRVVPFMNSEWPVEKKDPYTHSFNTGPRDENLLVLAPVHIPRYEALLPDRAATLTQGRINPMNDYLRRLCAHHGAHVPWSWSTMVWQQPEAYQNDGLHIAGMVAARQMDVILNLRCNPRVSNLGFSYPVDNTCCNNYLQASWVQRLYLMVSLALLPMTTVLAAKEPHRLAFLPSRRVFRALTTVALALCLCYSADRTQLLNKLHKRHSLNDFTIMALIIVILGILSIRQSVVPPVVQGQQSSTTRKTDQPFLSRDQTDEWKGWMQFLILAYHYTGTSKVLGIYKIIRILVGSYLFMTGFGHTAFFYRKADYSLRRFATTLIRLNLLSCMLPYVMGTDYLFYYFAPLSSMWYVIIYLTMRIGHKRSESVRFLIGKILVSAIVITGLVRVPGILEVIFQCLAKTANIHWNVTEWRFRVGLDLYIVYVGMLSAIAFIKISRSEYLQSWIDFAPLRRLAMLAALVVLWVLWMALGSITEKPEYNSWIPYISFLPILSFVVLRNCSRPLRNCYSSIFAWLGRYSLETFTLQYHIWLAADTKGILSMGLDRRWEFAPLTIIFLWVSWHVGHATDVITKWIVDPSEGSDDGQLETSRSDVALPRMNPLKAERIPYRRFINVFELRNDLRIRLLVILFGMCVLNHLY